MGHMLLTLLDGTTGFARSKIVHLQCSRSGREQVIHFIIRSSKPNVSIRCGGSVFGHFIGVSAFSPNANLKLTITQRVVSVMSKRVFLSAACASKTHFIIR